MNQSDLPAIRQLAKNNAFSISGHASDQMLSRNISYDDIERILTSPTNQIIERQSPSQTPGKKHKHERVLIYDPCDNKDAIIIIVVIIIPSPDIRIVTVENVNEAIWTRKDGEIPCLVRK